MLLSRLLSHVLDLSEKRGFEGDTAPKPTEYFWFVSNLSTLPSFKPSAEASLKERSVESYIFYYPNWHDKLFCL